MSVSAQQRLITAQKLCFSYHTQRVVDNISLQICKQDFLAIIGPNGAGKSTLVQLLLGLLRPHSGTITRHITPEQIGYVPQRISNTHSFPATVGEIIHACAPFRPAPPKHRAGRSDRHAISHLLPEQLAIDSILHQQFVTCSIGQQQRVLIALALLRDPQLLILDEPTSGIDATTKNNFYDLLTELNQTREIAIILITHEVNILPPIIRQVLCINNRIHCHGPLNELPTMLQNIYGEHVIHNHQHE